MSHQISKIRATRVWCQTWGQIPPCSRGHHRRCSKSGRRCNLLCSKSFQIDATHMSCFQQFHTTRHTPVQWTSCRGLRPTKTAVYCTQHPTKRAPNSTNQNWTRTTCRVHMYNVQYIWDRYGVIGTKCEEAFKLKARAFIPHDRLSLMAIDL